MDVADIAYVVVNNLMPAVLGTAELFKVFERLGVADERLRVILNHSHAGFRGSLQPVDVAAGIGRDIDHVVPYSKQVLAATNSGAPYVMRAPRWRGFGKAVSRIEKEVLAWSGVGLKDSHVALPSVAAQEENGITSSELPSHVDEQLQSERQA